MLCSAGGAAETKEWDGSTSVGGGDGHGPSKSARAAAEELLALDPDLAKKHSVKSLAAATETALSKPKLSLADQARPPRSGRGVASRSRRDAPRRARSARSAATSVVCNH